MQQSRQAIRGLSILALLAFSAGCASQQPMGQEAGGLARPDSVLQDVKGLPKWVTQKGAAFSGERRVFYGVGSAAALQNPSLRRRAAEGQARRDIAQTMQTYVAALQKQYNAETTAGDMSKQSVEQHITDTMKQVTEATLVGAQIIEYWEHPLRNEAYALARLDLEQFLDVMQHYQSAVGKSKELDSKVREYVRQNAAKAHDELNQELQKGKAPQASATPLAVPTPGRKVLASAVFVPMDASYAARAIEAGDIVHIVYGDLVEVAGGQDLVQLAATPIEIGSTDVVDVSCGDLVGIAETTQLTQGVVEIGRSGARAQSAEGGGSTGGGSSSVDYLYGRTKESEDLKKAMGGTLPSVCSESSQPCGIEQPKSRPLFRLKHNPSYGSPGVRG